MDKIVKLIGKNVRSARQKAGLSQTGLAESAKTSLTTINRLEMGRQCPHSNTLAEIAKVLGLTVEELYANETSPGSDSRAELILGIQALLLSLDESELRHVLGFIEDIRELTESADSSSSDAV